MTEHLPTAVDPLVAVRLSHVVKRFGDRAVLDDLDLTIRRGEFVALLGASGSGKTTLLRILSSLDFATQGELDVTPQRSVVFQDARLLPFKKVWRNVRLGLSRRKVNRERIIAALDEVGLADHADRWPKTLSGGESQRVALARALIREPHLLLLDEPFAALDALTRIKMHDLVLRLWRRHQPAVVFITHDVDEAILLADRVLVLRDGRFAQDLSIEEPRAQRRSWAGFGEIRDRLLSELGVDQSDQVSR
ncbi:ABC transporter ATP-binding protein [Rhodococcus globerulus]|uniref:ABC transporter ATP-binding protein n=1 Tax=Rhodococcus globerulus TaxID=33008 RepID=A0ABU4C5A3_RHOGO|nr:ABC transporter ATP-binding protein [Rhodococcus globerulus]MDV6271436.1 ABC transporter ATP-binding protein [Rhodococcus globerulus]